MQILGFSDNSSQKQREKFFLELSLGWDALIYDRYDFRSNVQERAWPWLEGWAQQTGRAVVELSSPQQTKFLAACAEIAGIPYDENQTEIPIPHSAINRRRLLVQEEQKRTATVTRRLPELKARR